MSEGYPETWKYAVVHFNRKQNQCTLTAMERSNFLITMAEMKIQKLFQVT